MLLRACLRPPRPAPSRTAGSTTSQSRDTTLAVAPLLRQREPLLAVHVLPAEPAFVAHEVPLRLRIRPRPQAVDVVFVLIDVDAAARAAIGADAVRRLQPPHALLVQKILAAQCADRAQVDHVAASLLLHGSPGKMSISACVPRLMTCSSAVPLISRVNRTHRRAHDAAIGEQRDLVADVVLVRLDVLRLLQPAVAAAVLIAVILQEALARLVARRAIERMIRAAGTRASPSAPPSPSRCRRR